MSNWKTFPKNVPVDGSTVWIRITYYYSQPFEAVYDATLQQFTSVVNSMVYPFWVVSRWSL